MGVIVLTGAGDLAFCSGGDQSVRGNGGYVGEDQIPRLNVLDLQRLIRVIPKPVIAMVKGYAIGGGHVLHIVVTLPLLLIMQFLVKQVQKLVALMVVMVLAIWQELSAIKRPVKFGSFAVSTMLRKQWIWA